MSAQNDEYYKIETKQRHPYTHINSPALTDDIK